MNPAPEECPLGINAACRHFGHHHFYGYVALAGLPLKNWSGCSFRQKHSNFLFGNFLCSWIRVVISPSSPDADPWCSIGHPFGCGRIGPCLKNPLLWLHGTRIRSYSKNRPLCFRLGLSECCPDRHPAWLCPGLSLPGHRGHIRVYPAGPPWIWKATAHSVRWCLCLYRQPLFCAWGYVAISDFRRPD